MKKAFIFPLLISLLVGCATDFENDYDTPHRKFQSSLSGAMMAPAATRVAPQLFTRGLSTSVLNPGLILGQLIGQSLDSDLVRSYRMNEAGIKVIDYGDNVTIVLPSDYFFDIDTGDLRFEREYALLEIAAFIAKYPGSPVTIMAFADDVASDEFTKELTQKQSHSILSFLWSHGIDHKRLHAIGYGKNPTIADNQTIVGKGLNRRVEIHWRKLA